MSVQRRPHVGWEVVCDARRCTETTATQTTRPWRKSSDRAAEAARRLSWVSVTINWQVSWVCPLHQTYDPRLGRWVATPLAVRA
jgi:hypothetical protein